MPKSSSSEKKLEWEEKIRKQRESGLSIERWCRQNQIATHAFHYWKERIFPKPLPSRSSFDELSTTKETGITIEHRNLRIRLDKHFDASVLKQCLSVLMGI